eukprot:gene25655-11316_t
MDDVGIGNDGGGNRRESESPGEDRGGHGGRTIANTIVASRGSQLTRQPPNNSEGQFPCLVVAEIDEATVKFEECLHVHRSAQLGLGRQDVVTRLQLTSHRGPQRASNGGLTGLGPARLGPARSEVCPLRRSCDLLGIVVANGSPAGTPLYDRPRYSWPRDATKPRTLERRRSIQVPTLS